MRDASGRPRVYAARPPGRAPAWLGRCDSKDEPAEVARDGVAAMLAGKDDAVVGSTVKNTLMSRAAKALPEQTKAATQAQLTRPPDE